MTDRPTGLRTKLTYQMTLYDTRLVPRAAGAAADKVELDARQVQNYTRVSPLMEFKGKPFQVLAVNLAEPLSRIEKYAESLPLGFPLLRDRDGAVGKAWKAKLLPASFLIGRDGRIHYVAYGELDWSSDAVRARVAELLQ